MTYDASNIKITDGSQFDWVIEGSLAEKYGKDIDFIHRGLEACKLANTPPSYFIQRYLEGDKSVTRIPEVDQIHMEILKRERR